MQGEKSGWLTFTVQHWHLQLTAPRRTFSLQAAIR
jgi:hypothetical protein